MRFPRNSWIALSAASGVAGVIAGAFATRIWHRLRPPPARTVVFVPAPLPPVPTFTARSEMAANARPEMAAPPPPFRLAWMAFVSGFVLLLVAVGGVVFAQRQGESRRIWAERLTGGRTEPAVALMMNNGCGGCHQIPGVPGADGDVGPPLANIATRAYLGGAIANSPEHLADWIRDARSIAPHTAMPTIGVSEQEARDMAAYLYAQR
jgi:cytochrome c1